MESDRPTPKIQRAHSVADFDEFRRLCTEYANSLDFDLCFQGFRDEMDGLPGAYSEPEGVIFLARDLDQFAGCVALKPLNAPGVCEMKRLWVRPEFRGCGIGRLLVGEVIEFAMQYGYRSMRLDTLRTMTTAITLYRSVGFCEIQAYTHNPLSGAAFYELSMEGRSNQNRK